MKNVRALKIGATLVAFVLMGLLSGCASQATRQPPQIESAPPGKARVYIYRDNEAARLRDVSILVDGKPIVVLGNRQYASILLEEGPHQIRTKWPFEVSIPPAIYSLTAVSQNVSFLRLEVMPDVKTITLTGGPSGPAVSNSGFGSQFVAQERSVAYEGMSYCSRAGEQ